MERWFTQLQRSRPGTDHIEFLAHVDMVTSGRSCECPVTQVHDFALVFFAGLRKLPTCFNLPTPAPKYVVMGNFAGNRRLMYSNERCELITYLTGLNASSHVVAVVRELLDFARLKSLNVACFYSAPWGQPCELASWQLITWCVDDEQRVVDGQRALDASTLRLSQVSCTRHAMAKIPSDVLELQIERARDVFSAVDMDHEGADAATGGADAGRGSAALECDQLRARVGVLNMVQRLKEKDHREALDTLRAEQASATRHIEALASELEKMKVARGDAERKLLAAEQDLVWANDSFEDKTRRAAAEVKAERDELKALRKKLSDANRKASATSAARASEDADLVRPFKERARDLDERHEAVVQRLKQREDEQTQLARAVDTLSNEKKAVQVALDAADATVSSLRAEVAALQSAARAVPARRDVGVQTELESEPAAGRLAEAEGAEEAEEQGEDMPPDVASPAAGEKPSSRRRLRRRDRDETTDQSVGATHTASTDPAVAPTVPAPAPVTFDPAQSSQDRLDASMASAYNAPVATDFSGPCWPGQGMFGYGGYGSNQGVVYGVQMPLHDGGMPLPYDGMSDPATEQLIVQVHQAVSAVCELARGSAQHRLHARDLHAQLRGMHSHSAPPPSRRNGGLYYTSQQRASQRGGYQRGGS